MELHTLLETIEKSGYFNATLEEQVEINKRINGDFDRFREGGFGQGLPALILHDCMPCRVGRIISADTRDEDAIVYDESSLIQNLDDQHRTRPGFADAIEVKNAEVSEVEAYNILCAVQKSDEYSWGFAPKWLLAPFGEQMLERFYAEEVDRLEPVYYYGDRALVDYQPDFGVFFVKISRQERPVEFVVLEHSRPNQLVKSNVVLKKEVYGVSTELSAKDTSFNFDYTFMGEGSGADLDGEVLRMLSHEEHDQLLDELSGLIQSQISSKD
jgi:hypothetical protein